MRRHIYGKGQYPPCDLFQMPTRKDTMNHMSDQVLLQPPAFSQMDPQMGRSRFHRDSMPGSKGCHDRTYQDLSEAALSMEADFYEVEHYGRTYRLNQHRIRAIPFCIRQV